MPILNRPKHHETTPHHGTHKTQNWFAVGLDFVIVVFGVVIGIQVANWNDEI